MSSVSIELSKGPRLKGAMVCWLRVCETVIKSINMKCCVDLTHFGSGLIDFSVQLISSR